jgi:hypothetical protein
LQRTARLEASEHAPADPAAPKVLSIDIGGSHVKMLVNGLSERRRFVSGPAITKFGFSSERVAETAKELIT